VKVVTREVLVGGFFRKSLEIRDSERFQSQASALRIELHFKQLWPTTNIWVITQSPKWKTPTGVQIGVLFKKYNSFRQKTIFYSSHSLSFLFSSPLEADDTDLIATKLKLVGGVLLA
jgi:hypothetical protein